MIEASFLQTAQTLQTLATSGMLAWLATLFSAALCVFTLPFFARKTIAKPSARSSHTTPTPQGLGIVFIALFCAMSVIALATLHRLSPLAMATISGMFILALLGLRDDWQVLGARQRLVVQALIAAMILSVWPSDWALLPPPLIWLEKGIAFFAILWLVNLTNFIDGIDAITLGWTLPCLIGCAWLLAETSETSSLVMLSIILVGALLGFLPFNRPKALAFMGDAGALPLGLIAAVLLYAVAAKVSLFSAMFLAAYPVADASLTLLRRLWQRKKLSEAHREHFYQVLVHQHGFSHARVSMGVFVAQSLCVGLALLAPHMPHYFNLVVVKILSIAFIVGDYRIRR